MRHLILKWSSFKNNFFFIFRLPNGLLIRLDRGVDKSQVEHLNLPFKSSGGNNEAASKDDGFGYFDILKIQLQ